MHDPSTVVGTFPPYSWRQRLTWLPTLITLWHEDPCLNGTDDFCGYSSVTLSDADQKWTKEQAAFDWPTWFGERHFGLAACSYSEVLLAAWVDVRWYAARIPHWTPLKAWELSAIGMLASNPIDDLRANVFRAAVSVEGLENLLYYVLRFYRTRRRPWWRRPRWHVSHWRFQIHHIQSFKRWTFSRCDECGARFTWNEVWNGQLIGTQWESTGPRWFGCTEKVLHFRCHGERARRRREVPQGGGPFVFDTRDFRGAAFHSHEEVIPTAEQQEFLRGKRFRFRRDS